LQIVKCFVEASLFDQTPTLRILATLQIVNHRKFIQSKWINRTERPVSDISVKIDIAAGEADRVFGDESAEIRIVPAGPVVVEPGEIVKLAAGEFVPGRQIAGCIAERIITRRRCDVSGTVSQRVG
jgi:hypothetical protein